MPTIKQWVNGEWRSVSSGYAGSKGDVGYTGSQGVVGYTGSQGTTGYNGSTGYTGSQGVIGYTGSLPTDYVVVTGDTMEGQLIGYANSNYSTAQFRNVIISSSDASGGSNGDIWIKYTP